MNFKWNSHQLNTYIYLSASVIDFRKQYDQLLVILGLSRYQTTGRFPGWKIHIQILPSQCICISDKSLNLYSLITVTRSYRNYTCFPFNRSTFSVSDLFLRDLPFSDSLYFFIVFSITQRNPNYASICFENGRHQLSFSMKLYLYYHIWKTDTTLFLIRILICHVLLQANLFPSTHHLRHICQ